MVPNIHLQLGCETCHIEVPKDGLASKTKPAILTPNNDLIALCNTCHEGANLHPTNMDPSKADPPMKIPAIFPIPKEGANKGVVTCVTCHYLHSESGGQKLLRGLPLMPGDPRAKFTNRMEMCRACHGKTLARKSPHKQDNEESCSFCHATDPNEAENIEDTIRGNVVQLCNFCHAKLSGAHFLKYNPFSDEALKEDIKNTDLVLVRGKYTCVTCHDQHGESNQKHYLREEFVNLAVKSKRINPHFTEVFCLSCHDRIISEGEKPTFKFPTINEVCNNCHATKEARGQIHPVGIKPPEAKDVKRYKLTRVPLDQFPLNKKGEIDCETCHQRECKQDPKVTGRIFLRGGPYKKRNDVCFKCHIKEEFQKLNPHKDSYKKINGKVVINQKNCVFCHTTVPTKQVEGMEEVEDMQFKGDIVFLCIRCHPESNHPGTDIKTGLGVDHLLIMPVNGNDAKKVRPLSEIDTDVLPLDPSGRITCSTCHMPHEPGLIEGVRGKIGGQQIQRLDIRQGQLCDACHSW